MDTFICLLKTLKNMCLTDTRICDGENVKQILIRWVWSSLLRCRLYMHIS